MYISASSLNSNSAIDFASMCMCLCVCKRVLFFCFFLSKSHLLFIEHLCSDTTKPDLVGNPW